MEKLQDKIQHKMSLQGDMVLHTFSNGLQINTETCFKKDPFRIIPVGGPQDALLNYILHHPELIEGKKILEPFAGSGVFGLMALKIGAVSAEFVDINHRAIEFQKNNAKLSGIDMKRAVFHKCDIRKFQPEQPFDLIIANPPFVITPAGFEGCIHSNGGVDCNYLLHPLIENIERWLYQTGEALIYSMQIIKDDKPIILNKFLKYPQNREIDITIVRNKHVSFNEFYEAYLELLPAKSDVINTWKDDILELYGENIGINHCIFHVKPASNEKSSFKINYDVDTKYGFGSLNGYSNEEIAKGRITENIV